MKISIFLITSAVHEQPERTKAKKIKQNKKKMTPQILR